MLLEQMSHASIAGLEWNRRADAATAACLASSSAAILRTMSRENVEVVRRAYEAWNRRDFDEAVELLAPDIELQMPPNLPDVETWRSSDEVTRGLEAFLESWTELRVEVQELIDAGDRVVALVHYRGQAALTGLAVEGAGLDAAV